VVIYPANRGLKWQPIKNVTSVQRGEHLYGAVEGSRIVREEIQPGPKIK